jgi:hypothetical protein
MPELCGIESRRMPLPDSWISATYLLKNKFKALITLLNISNKGKSIFVSILLGHSNSGGLNVITTLLFPLYPSLSSVAKTEPFCKCTA